MTYRLQRVFSEKTEKRETAKKAGMIAGGTGIGALAGLGLTRSDAKRLGNEVGDLIEFKRVKGNPALGEMDYGLQRGEKAVKAANKVRKAGEKFSKFAKTGKGKATLIGTGALLTGTGAYLAARKKDKKK